MNQTFKTKNPHPGDGGAGKRGRRHTSIPNAVSAALFLFGHRKSGHRMTVDCSGAVQACPYWRVLLQRLKCFGAPNIRKNVSKVNYLVQMRRFIKSIGMSCEPGARCWYTTRSGGGYAPIPPVPMEYEGELALPSTNVPALGLGVYQS